jgi:hypothetical protein
LRQVADQPRAGRDHMQLRIVAAHVGSLNRSGATKCHIRRRTRKNVGKFYAWPYPSRTLCREFSRKYATFSNWHAGCKVICVHTWFHKPNKRDGRAVSGPLTVPFILPAVAPAAPIRLSRRPAAAAHRSRTSPS